MADLELRRTTGDRRLYALEFVVRRLAEDAGAAAAANNGSATSGG